MKTFAYAYNPPDDFHERVDAYAKKNGVEVKVITDEDIEVVESKGLYRFVKATMAIHKLMDRDDPVFVVTLNGRLDHPSSPDAEEWFVNGGGCVVHIDDPHPSRIRRTPNKKKKRDESVAERLLRGRREGAKAGRHQSGPAPYGYRRDYTDRATKGARLVIEPREAAIVRMMFKEYLRRKSMKKLIEHLESQGIKTRSQKHWSRAGVSWILRNRTYLGHVHFGDISVKGEHPAIISPIIFNKVQKLIRKNNKRSGRAVSANT